MSFSYSFRDRPRLSDRIRGKSGDELFKELRKELDQDRKLFFDSPSGRPTSPTSNWGSSAGSTFPRAGHLFDDPLMRGHTDIRSHLEDLAKRHPEFADQLRYPAWSNDSRSNTWGRKRRGSGQSDIGEASKQQTQEPSQPDSGKEPEPLRGRPKDNLRNTVPDMGQKQQQEAEDKESRGQRSWSAPPDNRAQQTDKPRFVSKIEIHPVNPDAVQPPTGDATKPPMAPPKPQPQPQQQQPQPTPPKSYGTQPNVRHIPIFVEGRDEPVLPKNVEPEFTQTQAPPQQHFRPPPQPQFTSSQHHYQPPRKQTPPHHEQKQSPPRHEQPPPPQPQPSQHQPEPPPVNPRDPLYRVDCVQKDIDELKARVDNFSGATRSDKEYIMLDELLTRNLIKLDDIETEGKEEVRAARKNTIKSIQRCISVLENKVPLPGDEKKQEAMEIEQQSSNATNGETNDIKPEAAVVESNQVNISQPEGESKKESAAAVGQNEVKTGDQSNPSSEQPSGEKQMEVEQSILSGAKEVPSSEDKKEVTSEMNKEVSSNEAKTA